MEALGQGIRLRQDGGKAAEIGLIVFIPWRPDRGVFQVGFEVLEEASDATEVDLFEDFNLREVYEVAHKTSCPSIASAPVPLGAVVRPAGYWVAWRMPELETSSFRLQASGKLQVGRNSKRKSGNSRQIRRTKLLVTVFDRLKSGTECRTPRRFAKE